ncbi:MAG: sigma-54-dependent Fis family transcriptional regulator [Phycisphaerae bacterium]|nr:sigma-54-dependent Fis family transcriptional regulator [Phycisphaerae bacterium]
MGRSVSGNHRPHTATTDRPDPPTRTLVIDDDAMVSEAVAEFLSRDGHEVETVNTAEAALESLARAEEAGREYHLALCDLHLPGRDGLTLLEQISATHSATAFVMLTGYGSVESAVRALKLGASDYLVKPVVDEELRQAVARAVARHTLLRENRTLRRRVGEGIPGLIGDDPRMARIHDVVRAVAPSRTTVLMTGESGTGKSLVARAIHELSPRRSAPFVELSCGSIPETLLESELFGHVKGAFTGAHADKEGRFLAAHGGTLFLDEINSASPGMQLKLLRVLQERRFEPVGSSRTLEVDVRILLATNQPLEQLVASGQFRQDLYYRINVVQVALPPLRDRAADIPSLAAHFLDKHAGELARELVGFTPEALAAICAYPYPGNIRELANIIERAAVLAKGQRIGIDDLPDSVRCPTHVTAVPVQGADWVPMSLEEALRDPERRIITAALTANHWNRQKTAEQLDINRTTLYKKMRTLGIEGPHG